MSAKTSSMTNSVCTTELDHSVEQMCKNTNAKDSRAILGPIHNHLFVQEEMINAGCVIKITAEANKIHIQCEDELFVIETTPSCFFELGKISPVFVLRQIQKEWGFDENDEEVLALKLCFSNRSPLYIPVNNPRCIYPIDIRGNFRTFESIAPPSWDDYDENCQECNYCCVCDGWCVKESGDHQSDTDSDWTILSSDYDSDDDYLTLLYDTDDDADCAYYDAEGHCLGYSRPPPFIPEQNSPFVNFIQTNFSKVKKEMEDNEAEVRKKNLTYLLSFANLTLRDDSKVCSLYIKGGIPLIHREMPQGLERVQTIFDLVHLMDELEFLYSKMDYKRILDETYAKHRDYSYNHSAIREVAKKEAVQKYFEKNPFAPLPKFLQEYAK